MDITCACGSRADTVVPEDDGSRMCRMCAELFLLRYYQITQGYHGDSSTLNPES